MAALSRAPEDALQSSRTLHTLLAIAVTSFLILPTQVVAQTGTEKPSSAKSSPLQPWEIAAGGKQEFDVVSVRQNKSGIPGLGGDPESVNIPRGPDDAFPNTHGVYSAVNVPISYFISFAYKTTSAQGPAVHASLPDWANDDRFNVEARTDNHDVTKDQMRLMMQALLQDRFKMVVHHEQRELPVYAVVLAQQGKLGPKLRQHPAADVCSTPLQPSGWPDPDTPPPPTTVDGGFPNVCGGFVRMQPSQPWLRSEGGRDIPMSTTVNTFTGVGNLDRPTVDQTGLAGKFDWVIEFLPDLPPGADYPPNVSGPSFTEALKDQLGLKLVKQKAPFDFLIIDHVEHPSVN